MGVWAYSLIMPLTKLCNVTVFFLVLFSSCLAQAAEQSRGGVRLISKYQEVRLKLEKSPLGIPVYITSRESHSSLQVVVYGILQYPFAKVSSALGSPENWCKITPLHLNIKSCVSSRSNGTYRLAVYSGHKHYQPPEDAHLLDFRFSTVEEQSDYLHVVMKADKGPFFTKDHRITLEAVPVDEGLTFVRFSYDYSFGTIARLAIKSYFSTLGGDKTGFSITSTDSDNNPQYVKGVLGAVERNAVRYYFAVQAYLDSLKLPLSQQFEYRISRWYDLTAKFPRQLYEMDKGEYINNKRREHANQLTLERKEGS